MKPITLATDEQIEMFKGKRPLTPRQSWSSWVGDALIARIEQDAEKLKTVLDRESTATKRYDDKLQALEEKIKRMELALQNAVGDLNVLEAASHQKRQSTLQEYMDDAIIQETRKP